MGWADLMRPSLSNDPQWLHWSAWGRYIGDGHPTAVVIPRLDYPTARHDECDCKRCA